ncbi:MAG: CopG family transcriptional regulator [Clostridiales bacterium 43-6]|mgnify:CR=1 FL=1|nr:MAG: CopG family transcriptional regulator [Clostridiales bacterium 43-6]
MPDKKMGRPVSDNPKDRMIKIRMDAEMMEMLDECSTELELNRSEVVRKGIKKIHDELDEK